MVISDHIAKEENIAECACLGTAHRNGFTKEQAELCEEGHPICRDCPWRSPE